jgi:hypothetical protein
MIDLLFFLLLGHFCGDFALQSDGMASRKNGSRSALTVHVLVYTLTLGVFLIIGLALNGYPSIFSLRTAGVLLVVLAVHWLQDLIKSEKFNLSKQAFYIDQAIHLITLFAIRILFFDVPA